MGETAQRPFLPLFDCNAPLPACKAAWKAAFAFYRVLFLACHRPETPERLDALTQFMKLIKILYVLATSPSKDQQAGGGFT
jgi:hypothetical protein